MERLTRTGCLFGRLLKIFFACAGLCMGCYGAEPTQYKNLRYIGRVTNQAGLKIFYNSLPIGRIVKGSAENRDRGYKSQDRIFHSSEKKEVAYDLFGVADGHGGEEASEFLSSPDKGIPYSIGRLLSTREGARGIDANQIEQACLLTNRRLHESAMTSSGSTLTGVLAMRSREDVFIFNVADSPAFVVMHNGNVYKTINHDASNLDEVKRFSSLEKKGNEPIAYDPWSQRFLFEDAGGCCGLQPSRDFGLGAGETQAFQPLPYVYNVPKKDIALIGVFSDGPVDAWMRQQKINDVNADFIDDFIARSLSQRRSNSVLTDSHLNKVASSYLPSHDDDMSIIFKKYSGVKLMDKETNKGTGEKEIFTDFRQENGQGDTASLYTAPENKNKAPVSTAVGFASIMACIGLVIYRSPLKMQGRWPRSLTPITY